DILAALGAGVHGYIPKSLPSTQIASALQGILDGRIYVPTAMDKREAGGDGGGGAQKLDQDKLTLRQRDALAELLKVQASKEIARTLDIAEVRLKIHMAASYRALGLRTHAEAIAMVSNAG